MALFTGPENTPDRIARALILAGYGEDPAVGGLPPVAARRSHLPRPRPADAAEMHFPPPMSCWSNATAPPAPAFGLDDADYIQRAPEKGLITKQEARALSLAKLRLRPDSLVWDIGAGSGSVGSKRPAWPGRPCLGHREERRRRRQRPRQRRRSASATTPCAKASAADPRRLAGPTPCSSAARRRAGRADPPRSSPACAPAAGW
jgi:hypothetical protein